MTDYLFDVLACYENEDEAAAAAAAAEQEAAAAAASAAAAAKATFTQDQVNKFLADDRRKNETTQKAKVKTLLEEKEKILTSVKELGITEVDLENKIGELQIEIEKQITDCEQKLK